MGRHHPVRRDANHSEIVRTFEQLGCSVADTSGVGSGFADLLIGLCGVDIQIEIKTPDGTLEPAQTTHHSTWRGRHPAVVRSAQDCIELVQRLRRTAR